jgi:hypothetical protein
MNSPTQHPNRLHSYINQQLSVFDRTVIWPPLVIKEGAKIAFWWALPAMLAVCVIARYKQHLPSSYLGAAISDGIGPHLWNVIGTFGLALFGLAFLLPKCKFIADSAYQVLVNAFAMGGLAFGLLAGQLITQAPDAISRLGVWQTALFATGIFVFIFELFALNFALWYLARLMRSNGNGDGFLGRVERLDLRLRFIVFVCLSILPVGLFVTLWK